jgi:hypothetical protein
MIKSYSRRNEIKDLAEDLFERSYTRGLLKAIWAKFTGKSREMPLLQDARAHFASVVALPPVRKTIRVSRIIGTEGSLRFDCDFHPLDRHHRDRWVSVAELMIDDPTSVPPIQVVEVGDDYYVIDGHHRVSVARTLDHLYLDADVTVWNTH